MKKNTFLIAAILTISSFGLQSVAAQFPIKIPKINKPKTEQPKPAEQTPPQTTNAPAPTDGGGQNRPAQTQTASLELPEPNDTPVFLLETLEIKAKNEGLYVKTPNREDNPAWFPQVSFELFYKFAGRTTRFTAEWFKPDGSAWFTEGLEKYGDTELRSPYVDKQFNDNAVVTTGVYGLKITDTKTGKVHFQGKFKVVKVPLKTGQPPKFLYYVENGWNLPLGYVGFERNWTDFEVRTRPLAIFWFKGQHNSDQFEAELHYNNQRVATTDKGGNINKIAERGEHCYLERETCAYYQYRFEWKNVLIDHQPNARLNSPDGYFLNDKPGEYTVKIFYQGEQVREAKFTVDARGWIARNAFSEQVYFKDLRVVVPVKITSTTEKWNPATFKTDAFYGNPLAGFNVP